MYSTFQNWEWTWTNPRTLKVLAKVNNIGSDVFQKNVSWVSFFREKVAPISFFFPIETKRKPSSRLFALIKYLVLHLLLMIEKVEFEEIIYLKYLLRLESINMLWLVLYFYLQKDIQRNSVCGKCIFFTKTFVASICP